VDELIAWLREQIAEDERAAIRVLTWPNDTCKPPSRSILFKHDQWVCRFASEDSSEQVIRTATAEEGQLPEGWEEARPVPDGWIQPHEIARIPEVAGSTEVPRWLGEHIVRWDPARVMREVEYKRGVVDRG
jgi:hypothetical protein